MSCAVRTINIDTSGVEIWELFFDFYHALQAKVHVSFTRISTDYELDIENTRHGQAYDKGLIVDGSRMVLESQLSQWLKNGVMI